MACLALNVLNLRLIRVNVTIAHRLITRVTVDTVECPLAARKLRDGLIVILLAVQRGVITLNECHRTQIVVAAIMTGVALCIGNRGSEAVNLTFWLVARIRCVTSGTTRQSCIGITGKWFSTDVTGQAVFGESLKKRISLAVGIECL